MKYIFSLLFPILLLQFQSQAQPLSGSAPLTKADTLRGKLTPLRTCYDINYYHLDVKIDPETKQISGKNLFRFTATQNFTRLQFDLFNHMKVEDIQYKGQSLPFSREFDAVFVTFPQTILKGAKEEFTVSYSGSPVIAKKAPWDGGFIYSKDKAGNPWISVACQGFGASSWWPNKDHQSDEVDSMMVSISAPKELNAISNGRLRNISNADSGYHTYNWIVKNPINNYNVTFYIGKYAHWTDTYPGEKGQLDIDYWALQSDSTTARKHWDKDVKPMLKSFENWFGPYPFYEDGYKLVQAPHLGMEHQSAVAYGNQFKQGYMGNDLSASGWGLKFDFIVVHESGHEWFGNNITSKDVADMWIHESFTNYSEALYLESGYGKEASSAYVAGIRKNIENDIPVIGIYDVNKEGSGDMYYKGANMIHIIRQLMNDDTKFRQLLRGMNKTFYHQTVTTQQVESYISTFSGLKLDYIFDQYLRSIKIPVLEYKINKGELSYRWTNVVEGFRMPVKVSLKPGLYSYIYPAQNWKKLRAPSIQSSGFKADPNFYVELKEIK